MDTFYQASGGWVCLHVKFGNADVMGGLRELGLTRVDAAVIPAQQRRAATGK